MRQVLVALLCVALLAEVVACKCRPFLRRDTRRQRFENVSICKNSGNFSPLSFSSFLAPMFLLSVPKKHKKTKKHHKKHHSSHHHKSHHHKSHGKAA